MPNVRFRGALAEHSKIPIQMVPAEDESVGAGRDGGPIAPRAGESYQDVFENEFILGTPSQVADQIAELRDLGVRNLMLQNSFGGMSFDKVRRMLTQFGEEVIPLFS